MTGVKKKNLFIPKTKKVAQLAKIFPKAIDELKEIFDKKTNVYIDYANVIHWSEKLKWHIDLRRLKQFLDSFTAIDTIRFYYGTLIGDDDSERLIRKAKKRGYSVTIKSVKILKLSIDTSSIPLNSPSLLESFIRKPLLSKFSLETIEFLNKKLKELNEKGIKFIEDRKCNFDVEIGRDMLIDYDKNNIENFILMSGDSDFADPVSQLLGDNKKVVIFATVRKVSTELAETGAKIFDIKKIKEFICWPRELPKDVLKSQKDS
ncbi:NYN domain-containing protein [Patescibacteria group bacterium AH-259-L07]|nr:NYN domain-containing protein [Patescibacteria group bacterium AH-259-L07]